MILLGVGNPAAGSRSVGTSMWVCGADKRFEYGQPGTGCLFPSGVNHSSICADAGTKKIAFFISHENYARINEPERATYYAHGL